MVSRVRVSVNIALGPGFWPTVLSVEPMVQYVICRPSVTFCIVAKRCVLAEKCLKE